MKVPGTDVSTISNYSKNQTTKSDTNNTRQTESAIENKNISHLTEQERNVLPIAEKVIIDAIEKANKAIMGANRRFEFSIHEKTKEIMVKIIDSDTNEIIREIPPEKTLDMVAKMCEIAGIMIDERR